MSTASEGGPRVSRAKLAIAAAVVVAGVMLAFPAPRALLESWLGAAPAKQLITVSSNIEAHQSVLSFKTVQSHIVELPFDEGQ